jgi:hypothetical protein
MPTACEALKETTRWISNGSVGDPTRMISETCLAEVVNCPNAMFVLNYLLPCKEISTGLEKLIKICSAPHPT